MSEETGVGYKRAPQATRLKKGTCGNPKGRQRGRHRSIPYDTLLGQMVTIREEGRTRRVNAAEALMLQLTRKGLQGDSAPARASLAAIEAAQQLTVPQDQITIIRFMMVAFGVGTVMGTLGLAIKRYPLDQQRTIWEAARTPEKVNWPAWWSDRGER